MIQKYKFLLTTDIVRCSICNNYIDIKTRKEFENMNRMYRVDDSHIYSATSVYYLYYGFIFVGGMDMMNKKSIRI